MKPQDIAKLVQDRRRWFKVNTGFNPYPKQDDVLQDDSNRIAKVKGRQVGSTTVFAHKLGRRPMVRDRGGLALVISVTDAQSKMVLKKIADGYNSSPFRDKLVKQNERELVFDNGYRILSRAVGTSGKQARGYSPEIVYATEAAFISDDVYNAIEPSLFNTGGKLWLESSPNGTQGRFYRAFQDESFSQHRAPSTECPGVSKQQIQDFKRNTTRMEFDQEVLGKFVSDETNYFDTDLLEDRMVLGDLRKDRLPDSSHFFLGVDIARKGGDETAYVILEKPMNLNKLNVKDIITTEKNPLTDVMGRITDLDKKYGFQRICLDENSLGGGVSDVLEEQGVNHDPVKFTQRNKHDMYERLTYCLEDKQVKLPDPGQTNERDHRKLYQQLDSLQYEFSSSGLIKVHHPKGGRDDLPDALALAVWAARGDHDSVVQNRVFA